MITMKIEMISEAQKRIARVDGNWRKKQQSTGSIGNTTRKYRMVVVPLQFGTELYATRIEDFLYLFINSFFRIFYIFVHLLLFITTISNYKQ